MTALNQFKVSLLSDVGSSQPFLARSLGLTDILDATSYEKRDEIKESIMGLTLDCLIPAFMSLREFRKIAADDKAPLLTKKKHCEDMYKSLWAAYKDRMKNTAGLMGVELGFLFQKDSQFEYGCKQFASAHPEIHSDLIELMKYNRTTWQSELARFRNDYLEHHTIQQQDVLSFYSLERAESTFENVWITIEETLAALMTLKLPANVCLNEIPEAERNPSMPKRFIFAWINPPPTATAG